MDSSTMRLTRRSPHCSRRSGTMKGERAVGMGARTGAGSMVGAGVGTSGVGRAKTGVGSSSSGLKQTVDLPEGMPHEVIHRDDLVVLP